MSKKCCGFGNRTVYEKIQAEIDAAVEKAIAMGCTEFFNGDMGDFDRMFFSAVKRAKKLHPEIRIFCEKPYLTKELQINKEFYISNFDEIIIPDASASAHYKAAITKRNQFMIDESDVVLIYTIKEYGGAYTAKKYAKMQNKEIIEIPCNFSNFQKAVAIADERWIDSLDEM